MIRGFAGHRTLCLGAALVPHAPKSHHYILPFHNLVITLLLFNACHFFQSGMCLQQTIPC